MGRGRKERIGLALAGGGPLGAIYEIGALVALDEALIGADLTEFDIYVGVSSGAVVTAGLANGIGPREMHSMFILDASHHDPFEPELLFRPAFVEFARRIALVPELLQSAALAYVGRSGRRGFFESFLRLARGLPNGLFDNQPIADYLARLFNKPGRTNDFRLLARRLFIVATDLDSGRAAPFGAPGFDDVPISEAVKASSALPGVYPPARIGGRDYVDGAVKKTLHASVALKAGAKLLLCINPIVPYDAEAAALHAGAKVERLADGGLVTVLSQAFRSLIHSRMRVGMDRYAAEFPDADVVLFEPSGGDAVMFYANVFSYADRRRLAEHAYQHTRAELLRRAAELEPILTRHGLALNLDSLANKTRRLPAKVTGFARNQLSNALEPLERTLGQLEKALKSLDAGTSGGGTRDGAETAETHA